jgi:hypothetical protein
MDELIGHRRRYTRAGLTMLLRNAGFQIERSLSWGFPVSGFLVRRAHSLRARRLTKTDGQGVTLQPHRLLSAPAATCFRVLGWMEQPFAKLDLGVGYVVLARK